MGQLVGVGFLYRLILIFYNFYDSPPNKAKKKISILVYSYDCVSYGFNTQPRTYLRITNQIFICYFGL